MGSTADIIGALGRIKNDIEKKLDETLATIDTQSNSELVIEFIEAICAIRAAGEFQAPSAEQDLTQKVQHQKKVVDELISDFSMFASIPVIKEQAQQVEALFSCEDYLRKQSGQLEQLSKSS